MSAYWLLPAGVGLMLPTAPIQYTTTARLLHMVGRPVVVLSRGRYVLRLRQFMMVQLRVLVL
jgi:hypothetical protein